MDHGGCTAEVLVEVFKVMVVVLADNVSIFSRGGGRLIKWVCY